MADLESEDMHLCGNPGPADSVGVEWLEAEEILVWIYRNLFFPLFNA